MFFLLLSLLMFWHIRTFPRQGQMTVDAAMPLQKEAVKSVNVMNVNVFI